MNDHPEQDDMDTRCEEAEPLCTACGDTGWALAFAGPATNPVVITRPCRKCLTAPEAAAMEARL